MDMVMSCKSVGGPVETQIRETALLMCIPNMTNGFAVVVLTAKLLCLLKVLNNFSYNGMVGVV